MLGALLIDNEVMGAVAAVVEAEHFFWGEHQEVFACISALIASGRPATAITVKGYLKQTEIGGLPTMQFLAAIAVEATTTVNAAGYAAVVRDFAARRRLMRTGAE
ncbi:hypothetical protein ONN01_23130, partial [Salmonella enterica subsp. enterica serovar Anatum]|nr:hypothetical protein [Salmonella enterica subsp. enterica serovar Anatum]